MSKLIPSDYNIFHQGTKVPSTDIEYPDGSDDTFVIDLKDNRFVLVVNDAVVKLLAKNKDPGPKDLVNIANLAEVHAISVYEKKTIIRVTWVFTWDEAMLPLKKGKMPQKDRKTGEKYFDGYEMILSNYARYLTPDQICWPYETPYYVTGAEKPFGCRKPANVPKKTSWTRARLMFNPQQIQEEGMRVKMDDPDNAIQLPATLTAL